MIKPRDMSLQTVTENMRLYARIVGNEAYVTEEDVENLLMYTLEYMARMRGLVK